MYKLCVEPILKSDQFCIRCLANSTWSYPHRAVGWPKILGAVLSVGNKALATQASETKLRSCVTSNLSQMGKKLSLALLLLLQANFILLFYLVLKDFDISRFKVEALLSCFVDIFAADFALLFLKTAYSALSLTPLGQLFRIPLLWDDLEVGCSIS